MTDLGVNGVVVNCRAMANHLNFEEDIPRQKTFLCYNGLELGNFPFRPAWREPRDNSPLVIGTVAMLRPEKNLDLLFNAAACLRNKGFDLKLLIVGNGPEKGRLQTIAATLGLSSVTEFIPTQWDVAPWLARMDIFVLPSRTEAFPNAVMEAMACGIPVIVSRVGGNPELVTENKTGLMFRSNDAAGLAAKLEALLRNHALRISLSQAARQTIETRFSIEQSAQRMGEIYRQLLAQQPFSNQL
jgi:glycosyltransferase involved in cell wall biosynthesis